MLVPLRAGFPFAILALVIYYAASSPWSAFPLKSFLYAGWLGFDLSIIWLSASWLAASVSKRTFALFALVATAFHGLVITIDHVAYQFGYTGGFIGHNQDSLLHWGISRPHAFASEPSYVAAFLSFGLVLTLAAFVDSRGFKARTLVLTAFLAGFFAIVASTSRTGWLSLAAAIGLFEAIGIFCRKRKYLQKRVLGLALLATFAIAAFLFTTPKSQINTINKSLVSGVSSGKDGSGYARLEAHKHAWEMAKETRFLGTGLGASYKYFTATRDTRGTAPQEAFGPQAYGNEVVMSTWGQLLAEGGIPALLLYAIAGALLIRSLWSAWKRSGNPFSQAAFASAVVFFCFTAFWLGNVARGDVWVWFAIWSRMALPDSGEAGGEKGAQRA